MNDEKIKKINKDFRKDMKQFRTVLNQLNPFKKTLNFLFKYIGYPLIMYKQGKNPFGKTKPGDNLGLLEESIISDSLYLPSKNRQTFTYQNAPAGRWIAYDFKKKELFNQPIEKYEQGRLVCFPLEEIIENTRNTHTSNTLLDLYDLDHMLQIDLAPTPENLIKEGFLKEISMDEAMKKFDFYNVISGNLEALGIKNKLVYQVTPKGNSLLLVIKEGGKKKPKEKKVSSSIFEPRWNPQPIKIK